MLMRLHRTIRRHRRTLTGGIVLAVLATAGATVHAAAMADQHHGHPVADAVVTCLAIGGAMAIAAGAAFALRRVGQRPLWRLADPPAPAEAVRLAIPRWPVRAGPPVQLQVFRL